MKNKQENIAYKTGIKTGEFIGSLIGLCVLSSLFGLWLGWILKTFDIAGATYFKSIVSMFIIMTPLVYSNLPKFVKTIPFWSLTLATAYIILFV